ncbi:MAG: hypothetical protein H6Q22_568, partial [Bacteroidetes bacterium]|nr:hypothetical protein [Bacteroidota bacterium]
MGIFQFFIKLFSKSKNKGFP